MSSYCLLALHSSTAAAAAAAALLLLLLLLLFLTPVAAVAYSFISVRVVDAAVASAFPDDVVSDPVVTVDFQRIFLDRL